MDHNRSTPVRRRSTEMELDNSTAWTTQVTIEPADRHQFFRLAVRLTDFLLLLAILATLCCVAWSYSTQRYVDAFSDAIVPVSGTPEQKIQSILDWMAHPPARFVGGIVGTPNDRDPVDTLNYSALLHVCGTATNAFINLADTSDLHARRLLLLNPQGSTKHVDAEVWVDGRWSVVDPTFRVILRGTDGRMLTRRDLVNPQVFFQAVRGIPQYDLQYSFEHTAHIRIAAIPFIGKPGGRLLDSLLPGWQDSGFVSLVVERNSLLALVAALIITLALLLLRFSMRWYGENRLGIRYLGVVKRLGCAIRAFIYAQAAAT